MVVAGTRRKIGRLLAIGDIHGCLAQLAALLDLVAPTADDRLVFLGDYVDRGPESAGVLDCLLRLRWQLPQTVFLRGNHEQMFSDFLTGRDPMPFLLNGGDQTLLSYQCDERWPIPPEHRQFLDSLVNLHTEDEFIFVHAGLRPKVPLAEQSVDDLLWIRQEFLAAGDDCEKTVVFGHTPFLEPLQERRRLGLDTGCVYGRQLTCCEVRSRQFWSV
ncbi:MAG: metallophosphoesterase family protein [Desulfuromonadales bacterium]|nr:metallophosphoesterase family protein [Desulfuromonadales bacterium]